jgi:predicted SAM-dependent methyltransferase
MSFYYQAEEILKRKPDKVLEIGAGGRITASIVKNFVSEYHIADIDPELSPDFLASVIDLPVADNSYDLVACFEVLEHLPYENFTKGLSEIRRATRKYAIISLPNARLRYPFSIFIPTKGPFNFSVPKPVLKREQHVFDGQHYWEIEIAGFPLKRIKKDIIEAGFTIENSYRVPELPYHHFFCLVKG